MKQIFDWLRERLDVGKEPEYDETDASFNEGLNMAIGLVNEAEAKWEADCTCKGCVYENDTSEETECGHCKRAYSDCYEPIKISEVE